MGKLAGRIAIVTGGTSGMGKGIAELFAEEGAKVIVGGRDVDRGAETVKEIVDKGGSAVFVTGDVKTIEANRALIDAAVETYGGVDILVPNAGLLGLASITELEPDLWHDTIATNLHAVYYLLHLGIPELLKRGGGTVVVNGSVAAFKVFPNHAAYCASKGALVALVRQVALEYGPSVRINLLCPGPVDTPLIHASASAFPNPDEIVRETAEGVPMKRLGTPLDIAKAALYLASDDSSWVTGSVLVIDGGKLCSG